MGRSIDMMRRKHLQKVRPEIDRMVAGLQDEKRMLEAFEELGRVLAEKMPTPWQADMYMAVVFDLLPLEVQEQLLLDPRVGQSATILPVLKKMRQQNPLRPRNRREPK